MIQNPLNTETLTVRAPNSSTIDPLESKEMTTKTEKNGRDILSFKKRLIRQVRKHKKLYDSRDKYFDSISEKEKAWQKIAQKLNTEVSTCKTIWIDLRYDYQRFVRRLRKFHRSGNKNSNRRPIMPLETDLLFLWHLIGKKSICKLPYKKEMQQIEELEISDDDIVILESEPVVIDLELEEEARYRLHGFKITNEMKKLVEIVQDYPELYDVNHKYFHDYKRKGIIWNAVANEMTDKATKLMKCWIYIQTRYEWELRYGRKNNNSDESQLQKLLSFMQPHILNNSNSVCKQSHFLAHGWQEPIDHFKQIYSLIAVLKKFQLFVSMTEKMLSVAEKSSEYLNLWVDIAKHKGNKPGQCEVTWLVMRNFYWEIMNMRNQCYQLQDKWYFESIITEIYASSGVNKISDLASFSGNAPQQLRNASHSTSTSPSSLSPKSTANSTVSTSNPTISIDIDEQSISGSYIKTNKSNPIKIQMPKIASATSLAPLMKNTNGDINSIPASFNIIQPAAEQSSLRIESVTSMNTSCPTAYTPQQEMIMMPNVLQNRPNELPNKVATSNLPTSNLSYKLPARTDVKYHSYVSRPNVIQNFTSSATTAPSIKPAAVQSPSTNSTAAQCGQMPTLVPIPKSNSTPQSIRAVTSTPPSLQHVRSQGTPPTYQFTPSAPPRIQNIPPQPEQPTIPKITNAASVLNANEIMIELISASSGNQLVVHGPALTEKYSLSMPKTATFIREIMAMPLLHHKSQQILSSYTLEISSFWEYVSRKFEVPIQICKAIWNFLAENFTHFPQIAPMEELMKPFKISYPVWKLYNKYFENFDRNAEKWEISKYKEILPKLVEDIGKCKLLYSDLEKHDGSTVSPALKYNQVEVNATLHDIRLNYKKHDISAHDIWRIWKFFRLAFVDFMKELESGVVYCWSQTWWPVLAKMKFLLEYRYPNTVPYYYIVRNKIDDEIERCYLIDAKKRDDNDIGVINDYKLIAAVRRNPNTYWNCDIPTKVKAWRQVAKEMNASELVCVKAFKRALRNYRSYLATDAASRCRVNHKYFKLFHEIYRSTKTNGKLSIKTPTEVNQSVSDLMELNETVLPERHICEIDMVNNRAALVMKNWTYTLNSIQQPYISEVSHKLCDLFNKYRLKNQYNPKTTTSTNG